MERAKFNRIKLKADDYDRFVFEFIINRFDFFDGYYGHFIQYQPELKFEEFTTLRDDLKAYHSEVIYTRKDVSIKQIQSFKRSCELLRGKICKYHNQPRKDFIQFLDFCILNLDSMIDKFIDEILSRLEC